VSFPSDFRDKFWVGLSLGVRDRVRTKFSDRNVVPGLTKYADLGMCQQNQEAHYLQTQQNHYLQTPQNQDMYYL